MQLRLNLDKPTARFPTLVDMGASGTVYTSLVDDQRIELIAARATLIEKSKRSNESVLPWKVFRGTAGQLKPFVFAPRQSVASAEGWIHVMDRKRCLAMAISQFARSSEDQITTSADGTVATWKSFAMSPVDTRRDAKSLLAWLHFVHYPPQYSAGASPQAMQHPVETKVIGNR